MRRKPSSASTEVNITPETVRGRKALPPAEKRGPEFVGRTPDAIAEPEARMNVALREAEGNAQALAKQLGYEGSLTVGSLEDEIRFYQRRSAEAVLELGKRLLILKELTPHGEFQQRIELLGIHYRMAARFMSATIKFGKSDKTSLLPAIGNASKLLELTTLDDEEIAELSDGGSVRGIELDEISTMTASELRTALREAREEHAATERVLEEKNRKLDELAKAGKRKSAEPWPDELKGLNTEIGDVGTVADEALSKFLTFVDAAEALIDNADADSDQFRAAKSVIHRLGAGVERLCHLAAGLRAHYDTRVGGYIADDKSYVLDDPAA